MCELYPGDASGWEEARLQRVLCDLDLCPGNSGDPLVRFKSRGGYVVIWVVYGPSFGCGSGRDRD